MKVEFEIKKKELEYVNLSVKSKEEELKVLEDRFELESVVKLVELKRKVE